MYMLFTNQPKRGFKYYMFKYHGKEIAPFTHPACTGDDPLTLAPSL